MISHQFLCFTNVYFEKFLPDVLGEILPLIFIGLTEDKKHAQPYLCSLHALSVRLASRLASWPRSDQRCPTPKHGTREVLKISP